MYLELSIPAMASLQQLQEMDPYDFEEKVAEVWEAKGYDTHVRQGSQDRAIDVEAVQGAQRVLIQAKRYGSNNKVGAEDVRKYATLWQQEPDASRVILVTTSSFTSEAKRIAAEQNVQIIDGPSFVDMLEEEGIGSPSSSKSKEDYSRPDTFWGTIKWVLFPPMLFSNGILVGIIVWFFYSPIGFALAGLVATVKILQIGYKKMTEGDDQPTEADDQPTETDDQPTESDSVKQTDD